MSLVNITNVVVLDNPTVFTNPFQFEITFECLQDLSDGELPRGRIVVMFVEGDHTCTSFSQNSDTNGHLPLDLEWKVIYVGSSDSADYDQVLEEVLVGPVTQGCHKFVLQADAPDATQIPNLLGVTVVLITCSYQEHEFVRIGYYVNNELPEAGVDLIMGDDETLPPPQQPLPSTSVDLSKILRTTLADKPRVTRFSIPWDQDTAVVNTEQIMSPIQMMRNEAPRVVSPADDGMEM